MARSNKPVTPSAENALDRMKMEVATELGIADNVKNQGWATMTSADCGRVGGHMVRRMIAQYEASMGGSSEANTGSLTAKMDPNS
ncbi:MAG: alpha/beta-type small acid-soluble spore protein [Sporomusaceae bacterium]|nr:alpha/beta-type small acid-soluble spore protein [Sporomusaceae bacterium]